MAEAGMAGVGVISAAAGLAATLAMVVSAAEVETLAVEEHPGMAKGGTIETQVNNMSQNLEQTVRQFPEAVTRTYGESLLCLILYGSAAPAESAEARPTLPRPASPNHVRPAD